MQVGCSQGELEAVGELDIDEDENTVVQGLDGVVFELTQGKSKTVKGIYVAALAS